MQLVDLNKPGEKKKLISAGVLALVAILVLWWVFFSSGSRPPTTVKATPSPSPARATQQNTPGPNNAAGVSPEVLAATQVSEVVYQRASYDAPDARRNIFAYYEPPVVVKPPPSTPTPSPTPPPPVLLASVSPANVYARTADFKIEAAGDRFTPEMRIYVDGRELQTSYKNPQQVSATIPASFITNPGTKSVVVRTPDNRLYSNDQQVNVAAPPTPNFTYIGIISPDDRIADKALVQDKNNKNVLTILKGDVIGGRFRVTSISDKELVLTDTTLKIKHTLAMTEADKGSGPLSRPTPRVDSEDDEP